ncbi:MAG: hypothetical protein JWO05_892 [Gemmatimonadetes bacterium]|nr:hypothetical protein [Gemmatimonadota bacterium]
MWIRIATIVVLASVPLVILASAAIGAYRWRAETAAMRRRLESSRTSGDAGTVDFRELDGLPGPVQRYLRLVLTDGQPLVSAVNVRHSGTFNLSESDDNWKSFTSDQRVVTSHPGFDWNGRIEMMPGLPVRVHDAYIEGEGILRASLLGLFTKAYLHDRNEMGEAELLRYFAETAWYPTALLPSQGVTWQAVDAHAALATLTDGAHTETLLFRFDAEGLLRSVRTESRPRMVSNRVERAPWVALFSQYELHDGMRVPMEGSASWDMPTGVQTYFRGHITHIDYELAGAATH